MQLKENMSLRPSSAKEIDELIKNFREDETAGDSLLDAAKKKPEEKDVRDSCVRTIAEDLKKENWLVKAKC